MNEPSGDLTGYRQRIDEINKTLLDLLSERAEVAKAIGVAKAQIGKPVYDAAREGAVLQAMVEHRHEPLSVGDVEEFFSTVMDICRRIQFPG